MIDALEQKTTLQARNRKEKGKSTSGQETKQAKSEGDISGVAPKQNHVLSAVQMERWRKTDWDSENPPWEHAITACKNLPDPPPDTETIPVIGVKRPHSDLEEVDKAEQVASSSRSSGNIPASATSASSSKPSVHVDPRNDIKEHSRISRAEDGDDDCGSDGLYEEDEDSPNEPGTNIHHTFKCSQAIIQQVSYVHV